MITRKWMNSNVVVVIMWLFSSSIVVISGGVSLIDDDTLSVIRDESLSFGIASSELDSDIAQLSSVRSPKYKSHAAHKVLKHALSGLSKSSSFLEYVVPPRQPFWAPYINAPMVDTDTGSKYDKNGAHKNWLCCNTYVNHPWDAKTEKIEKEYLVPDPFQEIKENEQGMRDQSTGTTGETMYAQDDNMTPRLGGYDVAQVRLVKMNQDWNPVRNTRVFKTPFMTPESLREPVPAVLPGAVRENLYAPRF